MLSPVGDTYNRAEVDPAPTVNLSLEEQSMNTWKNISTPDDIDALLEVYHGFHDSYIVSANYQSGIHVDEDGITYLSGPDDHVLTVSFQSPWVQGTLEMRFVGVRQSHLIGWMNDYDGDIWGAELAFYSGLLPGEPRQLIVWASDYPFDPSTYNYEIHEPSTSFVIANHLQYRFAESSEFLPDPDAPRMTTLL